MKMIIDGYVVSCRPQLRKDEKRKRQEIRQVQQVYKTYEMEFKYAHNN